MGSPYTPYRETGMSGFGHYPWWAFCMPAPELPAISISMGWAIFWGIVIAQSAVSDKTATAPGFIAFLVIWYFADKASGIATVGQRMLDEQQSKINDLELEKNTSKVSSNKNWDWDINDVDRQIQKNETERIDREYNASL